MVKARTACLLGLWEQFAASEEIRKYEVVEEANGPKPFWAVILIMVAVLLQNYFDVLGIGKC